MATVAPFSTTQPISEHFGFFVALTAIASLELKVSLDDTEPALSFGLLLPLVAAWAARRHAVAMMKLLVVTALLPTIAIETSFGAVAVEYPKTACLIAISILSAASGQLDRWLDAIVPLPALRERLTRFASVLLAVGFLVAFTVGSFGGAKTTLPLARVEFESMSLPAVLPPVLFALAALRRVPWLAVAVAAASVYAMRRFAYESVDVLGPWLAHAVRSSDRALLAQCVFAAVIGNVLSPLVRGAALDPTRRSRRWLALVAVTGLLGWLVIDSHGYFALPGSSAWLYAALAFVAALDWGPKAIVAAPLALMMLGMGEALAFDFRRSPETVEFVVQLGFVSLPFAWAGARLGERLKAHPTAAPSGSVVDISELADVVERIDRATTLRSFAVVLVPAIVLWKLLEACVAAAVVGAAESDSAEPLWVIVAVAVALALMPLAFVVLDWAGRQRRLHPLSNVVGSVIGAIGMFVVGIPLGLAPELLPNVLGVPNWWVSVIGLTLFGLWMVASRGWARVAGGAGLVVCAVVVVAVVARARDEPTEWHSVLPLAVMLLIAAAVVGIVRLHYLLGRDRPRDLLFGALRRASFWVRMAALAGLPSSLWTRPALREAATWAFLLSRPLVYVGGALMKSLWPVGVLLFALGHALFVVGKRLAARAIWRPSRNDALRPPVLFLRSFEDDQFDFRRPLWQLPMRWFDLWSFRRNADEAMVDEIAQFGPVVALGQPGERTAPFGAQRHYSTHDDWQTAVIDTARRARAIVLVAGTSPGLRWEFELLRREGLLPRTVLLLHPDDARDVENRRAVCWLLGVGELPPLLAPSAGQRLVALLHTDDGPRLLVATRPSAATCVVALRAHFTGAGADLDGARTR